jgi:hypothetical protein
VPSPVPSHELVRKGRFAIQLFARKRASLYLSTLRIIWHNTFCTVFDVTLGERHQPLPIYFTLTLFRPGKPSLTLLEAPDRAAFVILSLRKSLMKPDLERKVHQIYEVVGFRSVGPYALEIGFNDGY